MCSSECWYSEVCSNYGENCERLCGRYAEMRFLMEHSGIPKNKQKPIALTPFEVDYAAFSRLAEIKSNMVDFVQSGKNLYIASSIVGNGKTSWALKLLMKYFDDVWDGNGFRVRGMIIHVPTFLAKCKDFKNTDPEFEQTKQQLLSVDLVVWDDIAGVTMSNYDYSQLLVCLDAREFKGLSNIFTGNITDRDDLVRSLGAKMTSRIWNNNTEIIEFFGSEQR